MEILVLGLNHKTAPLAIREKLSITPKEAPKLLKEMENQAIFQERLLLSTCNRVEIYGVGRDMDHSVRRAKAFLSQYSNLDLSLFEDKLYVFKQPDSVRHLFSVASGLDSMVIGETEIIGQVKDAYFSAHQSKQTGKVLNALFQRSFKVAKNLRTGTDIGAGKVSVASVAVDLAEKIFGDLKNIKAMVIGTGDMATQVAKALISRGAESMIISSYHFERAKALAEELSAQAIAYESYEERITETDVLIASTGAPHALIKEKQVRAWMKLRHARPLFLIDIAAPRNIEAAIEKIDNVYLYNIDDLHVIANQNRASRENELEKCLELVRHQTQYFMDWFSREFDGAAGG